MPRPSEHTSAQAFFTDTTSVRSTIAAQKAAEKADSSKYDSQSDLATKLSLMARNAELQDSIGLLGQLNTAVIAAAEGPANKSTNSNSLRVGFAMFPRAGATDAATTAPPSMSCD